MVSEFVNGPLQELSGRNQLNESKKAYQKQLLSELFDFTHMVNSLSFCTKLLRENSEAILGNPHEKLSTMLSMISTDLVEVAEKFGLQLNILLKRDPDTGTNIALQERVRKQQFIFPIS